MLEELERNLVRHAGLTAEQASRRLGRMQEAFPDAEVTGYQPLIEAMRCDPKDRHVLAAAVHGRCEVLVTCNMADFPVESLEGLDVAVVGTDAFLLDQIDLHPAKVGRALLSQVGQSARPRLTLGALLGSLTRAGAAEFAAEAPP